MFDTTFYICIHYDGAQTAGAQTAGAQMSSRPNGGAQTAAPRSHVPHLLCQSVLEQSRCCPFNCVDALGISLGLSCPCYDCPASISLDYHFAVVCGCRIQCQALSVLLCC